MCEHIVPCVQSHISHVRKFHMAHMHSHVTRERS